jgi:hypothetical protein
MSKMGVYGFLRILLPIFGAQMQVVLTPLLWMAVATIVLSAYAALAQKDLKRIFAYSSINHLGYCLLGIFAAVKFTGGDTALIAEKYAAMNGVFLQMFNHALTASTLFWFVAMLEKRSGGLRGLDDFGCACLYRTHGHRLVLHVGPAWPEWIYRGVPDLQRIVSAGDLGHFAFRPRTACHGNLYSWNPAARFLRAAQ